MTNSYYRGAQGVVVVFSIADRSSFSAILRHLAEVENTTRQKNVKMVLVGSKSDLEESRQVTTEEAEIFAQENDMYYVEASAKTAANVKDVFHQLAHEILKEPPVLTELPELGKEILLSEELRNNSQSRGYSSDKSTCSC
eukprot:CAMPEP_0174264088 /NCGR_PEP_ID=MMETSP0439-20130205/21272_1 /TAXON_ID=0 /ORGANISM="Stereomyxa ramosa, Strain Chinc5" /LENGTH=139 /DNA_ID=CAMNT_0015349803 /DNA_START=602 /DNA_END=1021 /DNA_ORIENTATION=+